MKKLLIFSPIAICIIIIAILVIKNKSEKSMATAARPQTPVKQITISHERAIQTAQAPNVQND